MICGVSDQASGQHEETPVPADQVAADDASRSLGRRSLGLPRVLAPVSISILVACVAVFLRYNVLWGDIPLELTLSPGNGYLLPGLITHMFTHANALHLLFNMLLLLFLGVWVESIYGPWRYTVLYLGAGVFAALAQTYAMPYVHLIGASGALSGVMAVFIRHFPHARLYLWGVLAIPAWLLGLLWVLYNIIGADWGRGTTGFVAHLGGFAAGIVLSLVLIPPRFQRR